MEKLGQKLAAMERSGDEARTVARKALIGRYGPGRLHDEMGRIMRAKSLRASTLPDKTLALLVCNALGQMLEAEINNAVADGLIQEGP